MTIDLTGWILLAAVFTLGYWTRLRSEQRWQRRAVDAVNRKRLDDPSKYFELIQHDLAWLLPRLSNQEMIDYSYVLTTCALAVSLRTHERHNAGEQIPKPGDVLTTALAELTEEPKHAHP